MTSQNLLPKAILFDMDGVLIESQDAWWKAINIALTCSQHPTITKEEFVNHLWGNDFKKSIAYLGITANVFLDCKEWTQTYLDHIILKENAYETLSTLHKKYQLAVITNTQRFITEQVLDQFDLTSLFDEIVCADDVKKGKPHPDIIFHACNLLNIPTDQAIVVGDTNSDFLASKQAGCTMIGMNFKQDHNPFITHLSEIPQIVNQLKRNSR